MYNKQADISWARYLFTKRGYINTYPVNARRNILENIKSKNKTFLLLLLCLIVM